MPLDEKLIETIVEKVVAKMQQGTPPPAASEPAPAPSVTDGVFQDMEEAIAASKTAQRTFMALPLETRKEVLEAIRKVGAEQTRTYAEIELEDTELGTVEGTVNKMACACGAPGVEDLEPEVWVGDKGVTIIERLPIGVIASINPITMGAPAIYMNSLMALAGGNSVIHNPHPKAVRVSAMAVRDINRVVIATGGPPNLVAMPAEPTVPSAQLLMTHPDVGMIAVMGGQGVINFAATTGKRVLAGGPGNTPVVVDETADIPFAAKCIVEGAAFANGTPCACEKEIMVVDSVADELIAEMKKAGAFLLSPDQGEALLEHIFKQINEPGTPGEINMELIGKPIKHILGTIGVDPGENMTAILEAGFEHPLVWTEQIMPVVPIVRCQDATQAIDRAVAAEQNFRHTLIIHSKSIDNLAYMAARADVCEFIKNGPSTAGIGVHGEGYKSMHIATGGEGHSRPRNFTLIRRCVLNDEFRYRFGAD